MDRFQQELAFHAVIGLDTSVFIYHLEAHPRYSPLTQVPLRRVQTGECLGVTSVVTIMELTVRPWQLQRPSVAREYEARLVHFPNLHIADITHNVARRATLLRARYAVRPADAFQVAAAIAQQATLFVTNDAQLKRLADVIAVLQLDEYT